MAGLKVRSCLGVVLQFPLLPELLYVLADNRHGLRCVNYVVGCLFIKMPPLVQNLTDFFNEPLASQRRALTVDRVAAQSFGKGLQRRIKKNNHAALPHKKAILFRQHHAAPGGDNTASGVRVRHFLQGLTFPAAEAGPALCGHNLLHSTSRPVQQVLIGVGKGQAEASGKRLADGGFARSPRAHQEENAHAAPLKGF